MTSRLLASRPIDRSSDKRPVSLRCLEGKVSSSNRRGGGAFVGKAGRGTRNKYLGGEIELRTCG